MSLISIDLSPGKTATLISNLNKKHNTCIKAGKESIRLVTKITYDLAQMRVPVESGALKASASTRQIASGTKIKGIISYGTSTTNNEGKPSANYAVIRHELPYDKDKPGEHKWLEHSLLDVGGGEFLEEVSRLVSQALNTK